MVGLLDTIILGAITAFLAVAVLYALAWWLQLADWPKTKLKQQLYQSGETVTPRKRRYLENTFIWLTFFSIVHVISFMAITLLGYLQGNTDIVNPLVYFVIVTFAILTLVNRPASV